MTAAVLVGVFGMLGALVRFTVDSFFAARSPQHAPVAGRSLKLSRHWPWATLLVNVAGSLLIGVALGHSAGLPASEWQTGLTAGLAGGLTTFSSWTTATVRLVNESRIGAAAANIGANLVLGVGAAAAGAALAG